MRGAPFNPQGAGVLLAAAAGAEKEGGFWGGSNKRKKGVEGLEPRSVLDSRRSPSPPTSTSTLSSSLGGGGGGGGSSDTAGVAAVSDNPAHRWPPSSSTDEEGGGGGGGLRKEEWALELQPIPDALMGLVGGGDKCGLGLEDWEAMLAESTASPIQEQTFLRWITRDMDEASSIGGGLKQQQLLSQGPVDFDGSSNGGLGFGLLDPGFGFEPLEGIGSISTVSLPPLASSVSSCGGFPHQSSSKISPAPSSQAAGIKAPSYGNPPNNPNFSPPPAMDSLPLPPSLPPGVFFHGPMVEKPQLFSPGPPLNPSLFLPLPPFAAQPEQQQPPHLLHPQLERHRSVVADPTCCPKIPFPESGGQNLFLRRNQLHQQQNQSIPQPHPNPYHNQRPMKLRDEAAATAAHQQQQQQALVDQLLQAAELVEAGNSVGARGILARLNHQLPSPLGKPLLRSAFYFKEALLLLASSLDPSPAHCSPFSTPLASPFDVMLKLSAYKAFSEVSPLLQFTNFTCTQALLEELGGADRIHIVDFDIGVGGQWSSFMQELAHRRPTSAPLLKITAFVSPCSHHPLELHLTRENLSHFAADLSIPFEFSILSLNSFDPAELLSMSGEEAIAVNLPVGSTYDPPIPTLLRLVKHLSPKIVVSVDQGCDRADLPFTHHFLHGLQSCMVLLDSIDAVGTSSDVANKIERFLLQPRIEGAVLGRHRAGDKLLPWRTLFASSGFVPLHFSNFTEAQAECLLKRVQVRGFHVEKRQASLFLHWQHRELASVSAWRC